MDYGNQILGATIWDRAAAFKNRVITRQQYRLLDLFGVLTRHPPLDRLMSKFARTFIGSYLYSIKVEVNTACTLDCEMCYVQKDEQQIPLGTVKDLIDQIAGCGVRLEILGGEPLLRKDILDIIGYARGKVPFISLYTNGLFATPDFSRKLKAAGLDAAIVTLISHREEVHDRFTGTKGSWAGTVDGIRNLRDAEISTYTFTAVHSDNFADFESIDDFVRSGFHAHPLFYQYIPQRKDDRLVISREAWREIKRSVLLEKNRDHMDFVRRFYMLTGNACSGGNFVLTVKANGSVQPCPFISDLPLGNIRETGIWEIYRNRYKGTRLREFKRPPDECAKCSYVSICSGGCKAGNTILCGEYSRPDHRCPGPFGEEIDLENALDRIPTFF